MRYKFKRLFSLVMSTVIFASSVHIEAFALGSSSAGAGGGSGSGVGGMIAVKLEELPNVMNTVYTTDKENGHTNEFIEAFYGDTLDGEGNISGTSEYQHDYNTTILYNTAQGYNTEVYNQTYWEYCGFVCRDGFVKYDGGYTCNLFTENANVAINRTMPGNNPVFAPLHEKPSNIAGSLSKFMNPSLMSKYAHISTDVARSSPECWQVMQAWIRGERTDLGIEWSDKSEETGKKLANMLLSIEGESDYNDMSECAKNMTTLVYAALAANQQFFQEIYDFISKEDSTLYGENAISDRGCAYQMLVFAAIARMQLMCVDAESYGERYYALRDTLADMIARYHVSGNADGSNEFLVIRGAQLAGDHAASTTRMYTFISCCNFMWSGKKDFDVNFYNSFIQNVLWAPGDSEYNMKASKVNRSGKLAEQFPAAVGGKLTVNTEMAHNNMLANMLGQAYSKVFFYAAVYFSGRPHNATNNTGINHHNQSTARWYAQNQWAYTVYVTDTAGDGGDWFSTPGYWIACGWGSPGSVGGGPRHGHRQIKHYDDDDDPDNPDTPSSTQPKPEQPKVSLNVTPNQKKVENECEQEVVDIKIKLSATAQNISSIMSLYNSYKAKNPNVKMKILLSLKGVTLKSNMGESVEPADPSFFNALSEGSQYYTPNATYTELVSPEFTDEASLRNYLTGAGSTITLQDTMISVCDKVINRYYVTAHVCFGNAQFDDVMFYPTGNLVDEVPWAADDAILYVNEEPHYYSKMRHEPVAEIKADEPYAERYEAMSGVPTTENLYFGTGATEFMVNVDLKYRKETATRTFTIQVNNSNCHGNDAACVPKSCSCSPEDGGPHSASCPYLGSVTADGITCKRNNKHPHSCSYTYTITVPVDEHSYMDITDADLYRLIYIKLNGNSSVHTPYNIKHDPELGYYAFYDQENYSSGNGRLLWNNEISTGKVSTAANQQLWGNTNYTFSNSIGGLHSACKEKAVENFNAIVSALSDVYCTVVSDYVVLTTSEGYQHIAGHKYDSQHISLSSYVLTVGDLGECGDEDKDWEWSKAITSEPITFDHLYEQEEMWENNSYTASQWKEDAITTTGYTGDYEDVDGKYDNTNKTKSSNYIQKMLDMGQPNLDSVEGNDDFYDGDGDWNPRYVTTDINIYDSTTIKTKSGTTLHGSNIPLDGYKNDTDYIKDRLWSSSDSVKPVTNGKKDTGHAKVLYNKDISYEDSLGTKWDKWTREQEAPYSEEHEKINDIVIHNPVSNRDAIVISNDEKYDDRYWGEMDKLTPSKTVLECPRNSTCVYSTLVCRQSAVHNASCYQDVWVGWSCGNQPLNTHVHQGIGTCQKPTYSYTWIYHCRGCAYNGDWITISHDGWPTAQDLQDNGMYHPGCVMDATYTYVEGGTYCTYRLESTCQGVFGGTYFLDTPGEDPGITYRYNINPNYVPEVWLYNVDTNANWYHLVWRSYSGSGPGNVAPDASWGLWYCQSCASSLSNSNHQSHENCHTYVDWVDIGRSWFCNQEFNSHVHTSTCQKKYQKVLICTDPHHHEAGEPADVLNPKNHYPFADQRCYKYCGDDSKHNAPEEVILPNGEAQKETGNVFINVDRDFQIYYPDYGDFEQQPDLEGISECVPYLGKGYVNNTDTNVWIRNRFFKIPTDVIDSSGNYWGSRDWIDLTKLPIVYTDNDRGEWNDPSSYRRGRAIYTFTCVELADEQAGCVVEFLSVASNAPEMYSYSDNTKYDNFDRYTNLAAKMSALKTQVIDIVGSIGSLTIHDTGDPRFAELFKQPKNDGTWLIPNVVRSVNYDLPNMVVSDDKDVRLEQTYTSKTEQGYATSSSTDFHGTYGITDQVTGGKNHQYVTLPLTPYKNNIPSLQKEAMRPGYNLYMDIETLGNYYGTNVIQPTDEGQRYDYYTRNDDGSGTYEDLMQITSKYYELDLKTGKYSEVDIYMKEGESYTPVYLTNPGTTITPYYNLFKWLEESRRRNYTSAEAIANAKVQQWMHSDVFDIRLPQSDDDIIGTPYKQYLIDLDRTFIGSRERYNVNQDRSNDAVNRKKENNSIDDGNWHKNSQRWHFTMGLPSSSVFVYAGTKPSDSTKFQQDIKTIQGKQAVIVQTINIKVRGDVWTLEYDGRALNNEKLKIYVGDDLKEFDTPRDPKDPTKPTKDPVIAVFDNVRTSADDIQTVGSH